MNYELLSAFLRIPILGLNRINTQCCRELGPKSQVGSRMRRYASDLFSRGGEFAGLRGPRLAGRKPQREHRSRNYIRRSHGESFSKQRLDAVVGPGDKDRARA